MLRVPSIKELTYKCKQCGFTNIKRKSISANPEAWGVSRGITLTGSYPLATPTPDTFDLEILTDDHVNLLTNPDFETWTAGDSVAPTGWTLTLGQAVAKESTIVKSGSYSVLGTCADLLGSVFYLRQAIHAAQGIESWQGKSVTLGAWVWCAAAATARVGIYDNVNTSLSDYHTGDSTWQYLTVTKTIALTATIVWAVMYTDYNALVHTVYYDKASIFDVPGKISFTAATSSTPAKINDASCRFADLGFVPGDTIIISTTSGTNDGTYTLATRGGITNGSLSLSSADSLTTESADVAGTVTLSIRTYKPNITTGCSFCGSLNSR